MFYVTFSCCIVCFMLQLQMSFAFGVISNDDKITLNISGERISVRYLHLLKLLDFFYGINFLSYYRLQGFSKTCVFHVYTKDIVHFLIGNDSNLSNFILSHFFSSNNRKKSSIPTHFL